MQAGAGDFAAGEQIINGCFAVMINGYATAYIMGRRSDGDRLYSHVDTVLQTFIVNVGEAVQ